MRLWINGLIAGIVAVGAMGGAAAAATDASQSDATRALRELHAANAGEIEMGRLAERKGQDPAVRDFGKRLVKDHSRSDEQVQTVAQQLGISLQEPTKSDAMDKEKKDAKSDITDLSSLSGKDFDQKFAKLMVDDHQKDIRTLQDEEKKLTGSPAARNLVTETIPVLKEHLNIATRLQKTVGQG